MVNYYNRLKIISTMIKIIEVECYFVVLNFNSIMRILFDILNIFHAIYSYKMYCSFEVLHN
jgi:hypothetical protein